MKIVKKGRAITITATSKKDSTTLLNFLADAAGCDSAFAKALQQKQEKP